MPYSDSKAYVSHSEASGDAYHEGLELASEDFGASEIDDSDSYSDLEICGSRRQQKLSSKKGRSFRERPPADEDGPDD